VSVRALVRLLPLLTTCALPAQRGDRPGEQQPLLPASVDVPAAPARTADEQAATMQLAAGLRLELFACEPLVRDPVCGAWDAAGRLWVCEFTSYMRDLDATDEGAPDGRVVVLHDDDGDGRADRSTVFADQLVLPRAVLPLKGGALVITPPDLVWMPDADGDLVADGRERVMGGFEAGTGNPEHAGNSLTWGFDHRVHLCNDKRVLRPTDGGFAIEAGAGGGQWGMCVDDRGRLWFNYNSDWLRCDLVPGRHGPRAQQVGGLPALNHRVVQNQSVWPSRPTPGINRGYQPHMLRDDHTLARTTAVCSPLVYRGARLPFDGDVFVCEPAGNCVRRFVVTDPDGAMRADNAYEAERREFLTSTDERFRPVNLMNGPDGALYVVDMYRGVIQHRNYVTSFLRDQVERRGLEQPIGMGRIWRVVADGEGARSPQPFPDLERAPRDAVVAALGHQSGAVRDLALRELVQRKEPGAAAALREAHQHDERPAVRVALLSALAGLDALQLSDLRRAMRDPDAGVVAFGLQHAAGWLARGDRHLWLRVDALDADAAPTLRWHAALAVAEALGKLGPRGDEVAARAQARLRDLLLEDPGDGTLRAAAATAPSAAVGALLAELVERTDGPRHEQCAALLGDLAWRLTRTRDAAAQARVLEVAGAAGHAWQQRALLAGVVRALPDGARRGGWLRFGAVPQPLVALSTHADDAVRGHAQTLLSAVRVDGDASAGQVAQLTADERARVLRGEKLFRGACAACHQLDGRGQGGLAPPLRDSEWVTGPPARLIRIALHGVRGPIDVDGQTWSLEMQPQAHLDDDELAAVLSYLRRAFGHQERCVDADEVRGVRERTKTRREAWTARELLELK